MTTLWLESVEFTLVTISITSIWCIHVCGTIIKTIAIEIQHDSVCHICCVVVVLVVVWGLVNDTFVYDHSHQSSEQLYLLFNLQLCFQNFFCLWIINLALAISLFFWFQCIFNFFIYLLFYKSLWFAQRIPLTIRFIIEREGDKKAPFFVIVEYFLLIMKIIIQTKF